METFDNLTEQKIDDYCLNYSTDEPDFLKELYRETHLKTVSPRMASGRIQGQFLQLLCSLLKPKNVLEIGTFTGYAAISISLALPENSKLYTIEANLELEDLIRKYIDKSNTNSKIELIIGNALKIIPTLEKKWDLVFIDANKNDYIKYYELVLPNVTKGGLIIADNVLWGGKVIEGSGGENDKDTKAVIAFNNYIKNDERVDNQILPLRDGLMIIQKK